MNILIVDSDAQSRSLLDGYLRQLDIVGNLFSHIDEMLIWLAKNPEAKVKFVFIAIADDDDRGFYQAVKIKDQLQTNMSVSILFMLSEHIDENYIKSIKYGDGYLLKPFGSDLLLSTIHYHTKRSQLNSMLAAKNKQLLEYKKLVKQEHEIVETIFSNHFTNHLIDSDYVRFHISPASVFNGDVLLSAQGPSGSLYLAVGDVTGHGLPAAIGAMPTYSIFRTMASKGKNIGAIAAEMNRVLKTLLPDNMMMALTLMELNFTTGNALIWSGGMPEIVVVDRFGKVVQKIISRHAPLTVLSDARFRQDVDVVRLKNGDRLYFYTDGIEEARNQQDEMFGSQRFHQLFNGTPTTIFDRILETHAAYTHGSIQDDDITLVEVCYAEGTTRLTQEIDIAPATVLSIPWRMEFSISPEELKQTDPVAQVIRFLDGAADIHVHQDCISTIVAELYNNALEHGLLKLDSESKKTEEGFFDYYIERKQRLLKLNHGNIRIIMEYQIAPGSSDGQLNITITDSGDGFDADALVNNLDKTNTYGRGIRLVKDLCQEIQFADQGRTVAVSYAIQRPLATLQ